MPLWMTWRRGGNLNSLLARNPPEERLERPVYPVQVRTLDPEAHLHDRCSGELPRIVEEGHKDPGRLRIRRRPGENAIPHYHEGQSKMDPIHTHPGADTGRPDNIPPGTECNRNIRTQPRQWTLHKILRTLLHFYSLMLSLTNNILKLIRELFQSIRIITSFARKKNESFNQSNRLIKYLCSDNFPGFLPT